MNEQSRKRVAAVARVGMAMVLCLGLVSCGGGAAVALIGGGVGTGGTGISLGTVIGFGSVVVDGTAYNSVTPDYFVDSDTSARSATAATSVELGDQLQIQLDASGNPSVVTITPQLVGVATNVTPTGFTVNGVPVQVGSSASSGPPTFYSGLAGLGNLTTGMPVEVHGVFGLDATGQAYVRATLVKQLPPTNTIAVVTGIVSGLDTSTGSFQIGPMTVQTQSATVVNPTGTTLANGDVVQVWSNQAPTVTGAMAAGSVTIRTLRGMSGNAQVSGLVMQLQGNTFSLSGIPVDASALSSQAATLQNGQYLVVQGTVNPTTGVLTAASLQSYASQSPNQVQLTGTITGFVSTSNFLVRGVPVDAAQATITGAGSQGLGNGAYVTVNGAVNSSNLVTATSVTVNSTVPDGGTVDYSGVVGNLGTGTTGTTFTLTYTREGVTSSSTVTLAPNVQFTNGGASQLANGASVQIEASNGPAGLMAVAVSFIPAGAASSTTETGSSSGSTEGVVYNDDGTTFTVNGLNIQINGTALTGGGTLTNGLRVHVTFNQSGGQYLATSISLND